ncbi:MAG: hypothetical protein M3Y53_06910 [Thermoproteota archaeon]|nr:hypothetical protein [Thermoproteota archaeon]
MPKTPFANLILSKIDFGNTSGRLFSDRNGIQMAGALRVRFPTHHVQQYLHLQVLSGFTSSTRLASSTSFGCESNLLISSSSVVDLTTTPLFFVAAPEELIGLTSIANDAVLPLNEGNFNRKTPGTFVVFLS